MKRSIRALCALLASLMLTGALASCAETNEPAAETKPPLATDSSVATNAENTEESEREDAPLRDEIPDGTTFDNQEVVILSRYREGWTSGEIAVEALNTDLINDTVYERNKEVGDRRYP